MGSLSTHKSDTVDVASSLIHFKCGCSYSDARFVDNLQICREHHQQAQRLTLERIVKLMQDGVWPAVI